MQSNQALLPYYKNNTFSLDFLKGSIGQAVVATYFRNFGYEIYPYGYENNYANITRFIRRDYLDTTSTKIRSMPDLLVYDRDNDESFLLQIKATSWKDELKYWIAKEQFDSYKKYWSEAMLIIYCIPTARIYCCKIEDIKNFAEGSLSNKSGHGYYLTLADFFDLPDCFRRIKHERYSELSREIQDIFKAYSHISA